MALGDGTIKQNKVNMQPVQTTTSSNVGVSSESTKNFVVPVAIDEELLKLLGLTLEQYSKLSDEQKNEINNQIDQIKCSVNETNFGIKGLSVEKTTTNETENSNLTSIGDSADIKSEVEDENNIKNSDDLSKQQITESDWKQMSAKERALYLKNQIDETVLKDVPNDKKGEAIKELIDQSIKQNRGFSDARWENMSDARKDRLRERFLSDFSLVIENGFTKEDFDRLSYDEKLHLEIDLKEKRIQNLINKLEEISVNSASEVGAEEYEIRQKKLSEIIEKEKKAKEKTESLDRLHEAFDSLLSDNNKSDIAADKPSSDSLGKIKSDKRDVTTVDDVETKLGREINFKNDKDIALLAKALSDKNLSPEAKLFELVKIADNLSKMMNSSDPKIQARATEQYSAYMERLYELGFDEHIIEDLEKNGGKLSEESANKVNEISGLFAEGLINIKHPTAGHRKTAQMVANLQGIALVNGCKPDESFDRLYKNAEYTEVVGDGLRKVKGSKGVHSYMVAKAPQLAKQFQVSETQKNMDYTYTFDSESDIIAAQKSIADTMGDFHVDNQSDIYKIIMSSKFDDVQEYAANNIYKLDESVRDWASEFTKSLGKENLIDAIKSEPPVNNESGVNEDLSTSQSSSPNNTYNETQNYVPPVKYQELSNNAKVTYDEVNIKDEVVSISDAIKMFKRLSRKEQADVLEALSPAQFDKLPVQVCENFPEFIPKFVNMGKGIDIITSCSPVTADAAIRNMKSSNGRIKKQLTEFIMDNPARFTKISQEYAEKALHIEKDENKPLKLKA